MELWFSMDRLNDAAFAAGYRKAISLLLIALARDPALSFFLFLVI
jgi:hypothetical protein